MAMLLPAGSYIASGPVIIENGRVLLNKERKEDGSVSQWAFPGGRVEDADATLEDTCRREAREELGIEIELIRPLRPIMYKMDGKVIMLVHFLARRTIEITPGKETAAWDWHDIKNLPPDCKPNVYEIIRDYLHEL
jgi:ADP-ribose pyrophosphatase YjhB (NUDIX family)